MSLRKILFWCHLCVGCSAGLVILVMSVTGVLLGFDRQIIAWGDSRYQVVPPAAHPQLISLDTLPLTTSGGEGPPPSVTLHANPASPLELSYGRERIVLVNPYNGQVLGEAPRNIRAFFAATERWHRALGGAIRNGFGRSVTGACNLLFLGLVVSGIFLWSPRQWTWKHIRPAIWFRSRLRGRARDWNWHNTIGFWCAIPLFFVVLCGVIMSYQWANNLLYQVTGTQPPPPPNAPPGFAGNSRGRGEKRPPAAASTFLPADRLLAQVKQQSPGWKTITFRVPTARDRTITFATDAGSGGQPQSRSQITMDRQTGSVLRVENFNTYNLGRKLRLIARFLHTGEVLGLPGQVIATLASLGGVFLVWSGLALAWRRLMDWRARRARKERQADTRQPLSV